jgi:hypothetical protein
MRMRWGGVRGGGGGRAEGGVRGWCGRRSMRGLLLLLRSTVLGAYTLNPTTFMYTVNPNLTLNRDCCGCFEAPC